MNHEPGKSVNVGEYIEDLETKFRVLSNTAREMVANTSISKSQLRTRYE